MAAIRQRSSIAIMRRESSTSLRDGANSANGNNHTNGNGHSNDGTSVQVAVRIRPLTGHDQSAIPARWQKLVVNALSSNAVQVDATGQTPPGATAPPPGAAKRPTFTFDRVLSPNDGQEQVYNMSVMPMISRFLEGYNVTILAYGQTSSGKSYTMGTALNDDDFEGLVAGQKANLHTGIIPRAVAQIFNEIKLNQSRGSNTQYIAKVSFIEIYNEELIDLLADGSDSRPLVQIREDKAGHIIWSGLREVRAQNVADVMTQLLQGSAVRRTNETDMNAQSSRSHAIFSLTLVQKRYTGSGSPNLNGPPSAFGNRNSMLPRSTTPTGRSTPTGRTSGLPRPTSSIANRVTSPARPGPSTHSGLLSGRTTPATEDRGDAGEWVTVTSKFHFVDLAGSERLKRTAAQGDRVKEGISINSGLHALGNVISALGDPAKSRRTTHIPYRDSKLTRLLQDSLGGNAHTLMIACVSPTEYNVNETVNTLQYANRARNIKNKAELNEVEVGWDDIEYLQTQVLKLRKELQIVKGFRTGTPGSEAALRAMDQKDVLEWQSKYTALSQKHSQMVAEITRLQQQANKESLSSEEYLKAAEPIIIEYEKTVDALEGQINLLRAAVGHSEDVIMEHERDANDRESKISEMEKDLEAREKMIADLQARMTKLQDREVSADRYAQELESRLVENASHGDADAQAVADLKKDLAKQRDADGAREQYIKELEARLTNSEESLVPLRAAVAKAEEEVQRKEEAYRDLQNRMEILDSTKDNKALLEELDQRDAKLFKLESQLDKLQLERDEVVRERGKLTEAAAAHALERGKLEDQIRELKNSSTLSKSTTLAAGSGGAAAGAGAASMVASRSTAGSSVGRAQSTGGTDSNEEEMAFLQTHVEMLTNELDANKESSQKLIENMAALEAKYKQSLMEIDDLNRQMTEMKLVTPSTPLTEDPPQFAHTISRSRRSSITLGNGASTPRKGRPESLLMDNSPARRKSLSRRSSGSFLGYNPRESTPREGLPTQPKSAVPKMVHTLSNSSNKENDPSLLSASGGSDTLYRTRSLSQSLAQDLQSGGRRHLSLSGSADFAKLGWNAGSIPSPKAGVQLTQTELERRVASLEAEAKTLQNTLKERDEEIGVLEKAVKTQSGFQTPNEVGSDATTAGANLTASHEGSANVDEIMRAMARKDTEAQIEVQRLTKELEKQKKENDAFASIKENQQESLMSELQNMQQREATLLAELEQFRASKISEEARSVDHAALQQSHERAITDLSEMHDAHVKEIEGKHVITLTDLKKKHSESLSAAIEQQKIAQEHSNALDALRDQHLNVIKGHETLLATRGEEHTRSLADKDQAHSQILEELRGEHVLTLKAKDDQHADALRALVDEQSNKLTQLGQQHQQELQFLRQEHTSALQDAQTKLAEVQKMHAAALATHESDQTITKRDMDTLQQNHVHVLEQLEALKTTHSERIHELTREHTRNIGEVENNLKHVAAEREALNSSHADLQNKYQAIIEADPNDVVSLRAELAETSDALVTMEDAFRRMQEERDLLQHQLEEIKRGDVHATQAKNLSQAQKEVEHLQASLANVRSELQRSKSDIQGMLEEKTRQESLLREMQIKLTIAETRSASNNRSREGFITPSQSGDSSLTHEASFSNSSRSPISARRESSDHEGFSRNGRLGVSSSKPPPLSPPPNVPPPPTPSMNGATTPTQRNSGVRSSASSSSLAQFSQSHRAESPSLGGTGLLSRSSSTTSINTASMDGSKATSKLVSEQAEEIEKLTRQLNHCEQDLSANIDLVATLEAALNDSERNLRKSRVQLSEATRERERYASQCEDLRQQLEQAQQEVERERSSGRIERQGWESRIKHEREAKERARRDLDTRLDEMQKKKNSKLFCM
ncbi:hypothetical protein L7F22_018969 [Adiantum nelumboides]|nr:hypothetical protein [Adiantum nelumboides]